MTDSYVMGRNSAETRRLQMQADLLAPHSAHLFRLAGISPGMRVLDVGCGAGDVSMLLADLVGPTGSVIGVDIDPVVLDLARTRAGEAGLSTVSFVQADLAELQLDEPVDALVGRLILMHLREPAATVRTLSRLVRPGGVVSFQDYITSRTRAVPATPLVTKTARWVVEAIRAGGASPDVGEQIASILSDAGLAVLSAASVGAAGGADSVVPEFFAATARSVLPMALAHGLVAETDVDIDRLAEQIARELKEASALGWPPELVAAWARVR
ncbi:MAG TPA: methyltransferase domain-containing protein [Pseudonocardiaceae bacterium]|jgi:ubiquinone/menaquinone biosynthesis C-methylase UbiE